MATSPYASEMQIVNRKFANCKCILLLRAQSCLLSPFSKGGQGDLNMWNILLNPHSPAGENT
jgi:hypothetical protein